MSSIDFSVRDEGTIVLFLAESNAAKEWWDENVQDGMSYAGHSVVDHRMAGPILDGLFAEGFEVALS